VCIASLLLTGTHHRATKYEASAGVQNHTVLTAIWCSKAGHYSVNLPDTSRGMKSWVQFIQNILQNQLTSFLYLHDSCRHQWYGMLAVL